MGECATPAGDGRRAPLSLKQARRPRPSRVKGDAPQPQTPAERLALCLELSDFCLELRAAARRRRA